MRRRLAFVAVFLAVMVIGLVGIGVLSWVLVGRGGMWTDTCDDVNDRQVQTLQASLEFVVRESGGTGFVNSGCEPDDAVVEAFVEIRGADPGTTIGDLYAALESEGWVLRKKCAVREIDGGDYAVLYIAPVRRDADKLIHVDALAPFDSSRAGCSVGNLK